MSDDAPKPSKDEITIRRLRKQLKRTQERAARLSTEAGERYLKSIASVFVDRWKAEVAAHARTKNELSKVNTELRHAKAQSAGATLDAVRRLIEQERAER